MAPPIRIVLADPHPLVVHALSRLLGADNGLEIVATCRDGGETIRAVRQHAPDVVVLAVRLPGVDGLEALRQIRATNAGARVVLLTAGLTEDERLEARRYAIDAMFPKETAPELLIQCIRAVHAGQPWLSDGFPSVDRPRRRESGVGNPTASLTGREVEIVRLTATGIRNREVARRLHISECTVKAHLHNVYGKLAVGSRLELSVFARNEGIV